MEIKDLKKFIPLFNLLIIIIIILLLLLPSWDERQRLEGDIKQIKNNIASIEQNLEELKTLDKEQIERLQQLIPSQTQEPELLVQFEDIALKSRMILQSISFNEGEEAGEIIANQTLKGTYTNFKRYLSELESNLRLMDIIDINFSAPTGRETHYSITLGVKSYFYEQKR